jgi:2'-5' RNA ligase
MTSGKQNDRARVFFALWPDAAGRAALAAWQPPLRELCGGKPMRAETLHATLVFLGDVAVHRLEALQLAAQEVAGEPFRLCLNQAHYWGHNHIVYAAASMVPAPLLQLVRRLEQNLRRHRFHFDRRDYRLHLTLLRHAQWSDVPLPAPSALTWQVRDFVLVQSLSDEHGARYQVLARFPLAAVAPGGLP